jgi:16S rRNA (uracil1498-N3)-methyltransferase
MVCDGTGMQYTCQIAEFSPGEVVLSVLKAEKASTELPVRIKLYQGLPKKDKMELIIQKAVELGAAEIIPVMTKRCIVKLEDDKKEAKKIERWQAIAESAAKQSGRGIIPEVTPIVSYKKALEMMSGLDKTIMFYEAEGGKPFGEVDFSGAKNIGLVIGSEGGFDADEVGMAVDAGTERVWLGKGILRCETAPITGLSILMFLTNNM